MKRVYMKCRNCGYEASIEVLTPEEIIRNPDQPRHHVTCPKCQSQNVEIRD